MTQRNIVVRSIETAEGGRCVDVFRRPDGGFGFAEFRRDPEDTRGWHPIGATGEMRFESEAAALDAARGRVAWLNAVLDG